MVSNENLHGLSLHLEDQRIGHKSAMALYLELRHGRHGQLRHKRQCKCMTCLLNFVG